MTKPDLEIHIDRLVVHSEARGTKTTTEDFAAQVQKAIGERLANAEASRQAGSRQAWVVADGILDLQQVAEHFSDMKGRS